MLYKMKDAYYTKEELKKLAMEEYNNLLKTGADTKIDKENFSKKYFVDKCSYLYGTIIFKVYLKEEGKMLKLGTGAECHTPIEIFYEYDDYKKWYDKTIKYNKNCIGELKSI